MNHKYNLDNFKYRSGFSLIELLIVVMILAILATFLFWIINPRIQLNKANNSRVGYDTKTIQTAMWQYYIDNQTWPANNITNEFKPICDTNRLVNNELNCSYEEVNLSKLVPDYLVTIPIHPNAHNGDDYYIKIENNEPVVEGDRANVDSFDTWKRWLWFLRIK